MNTQTTQSDQPNYSLGSGHRRDGDQLPERVAQARTTISPLQLFRLIPLLYKKKGPQVHNVMLYGGPGGGKSESVKQSVEVLSESLGKTVSFRLVSVPTLDPTDVKGIPYADAKNSVAKWFPPEFFPQDPDAAVIFFLDEFTLATPAVQGALLTFIQGRETSTYKVPDGVFFVGAGNREVDMAFAEGLSAPMRSRFLQYEFAPDFEEWQGWATQNDVDPMVLAYLRWRRGEEGVFQTHELDLQNKAFPCARGWTDVSNLLKTPLSEEKNEDLLELSVIGKVGKGAGLEFMMFRKQFEELPNISDILKSPMKAPIPDSPSAKYAVVTTIARFAKEDQYLNPVAQYISRFDDEFGMLAAHDACKINPDIILGKDTDSDEGPLWDFYQKMKRVML